MSNINVLENINLPPSILERFWEMFQGKTALLTRKHPTFQNCTNWIRSIWFKTLANLCQWLGCVKL